MSDPSLDDLLDSALDEFDQTQNNINANNNININLVNTNSTPTIPKVNNLSIASPPVAQSSSSQSPDLDGFLQSMKESVEGKELLSMIGEEKMQELTKALGELATQELSNANPTSRTGNNTEPNSNELAQLANLAAMLEKAAASLPNESATNTSNNNNNLKTSNTANTASLSPNPSPSVSNSGADFNSSISDAVKMIAEGSKDMPQPQGLDSMDELLNKFMAEFEQNAGNNNNNTANNGEIGADMIEKLMGQMLSKEYLYQPMKDIAERYPSWLDTNKDKLSVQEFEQYTKQETCFQRIVASYERAPNDTKVIMDLMTEMQNYGQPPKELVKDLLPPGVDFNQDGLPAIPGLTDQTLAATDADIEKLTQQNCPTM
jgi:peroxin-19